MATFSKEPLRSPVLRLHSAHDERLASRVGEADEQAFTELYARHHQALYRYCRAILRDETDAQDALQSTWTRALVALRGGRRDAPLRPWLYRIAHNESVSVLRRRTPPADPVGCSPGPQASAEHQVIERERFSMLVADLRALSERPRGALVMRELNGLSHEEIASALDTSVAGAKQSIYEARRELADLAAGREADCDDICRRMSDGDGRVLRGRRIRAHLRSCASCAAFAAAIGRRRSGLNGLVPWLPAAVSASLLRHVLSGAGHRALSAGAAGSGAAAATTGGTVLGLASKGAGVALLAKVAAGAAAVAVSVAVVSGAGGALTASPHASGAPRARLAADLAGTVSARGPSVEGATWSNPSGDAPGAHLAGTQPAGAGNGNRRTHGHAPGRAASASRSHGNARGRARRRRGSSAGPATPGGSGSGRDSGYGIAAGSGSGIAAGSGHSRSASASRAIHPVHPSTPPSSTSSTPRALSHPTHPVTRGAAGVSRRSRPAPERTRR